MYALETWDHFLLILLIKPEHNDYFTWNCIVEQRIKECDQSDLTCKNGGGAFPDERSHLVNSQELPQNATLTLSCVFGC